MFKDFPNFRQIRTNFDNKLILPSLMKGNDVVHGKLTSNQIGNRQLLGHTHVGTVSDFFTVYLFIKWLR